MKTGKYLVYIIVFIIFLMASFSIVYWAVTKYDVYDPASGGRTGDVAQYINIHNGVPLNQIPKPYRYRVLVPLLARVIPNQIGAFEQFFEIDAIKLIKLKFGIINTISLASASFFLFLICRHLKMLWMDSILGGFLFLTSFYVVNYAAVPLVDAAAYLILCLGLFALLKSNKVLLFICFTLGMFVKETTILIFFCVFLMSDKIKSKVINSLVCLPGILAYGYMRFILFPTTMGYNYSLLSAIRGLKSLFTPGTMWLRIIMEAGFTFGILWLLALGGFWLLAKEKQHPLYRFSFLVPVVFVMPFLVISNLGRVWFYSFPVIIPLALMSLRYLIDQYSLSEHN